jgi:hypothetical protein
MSPKPSLPTIQVEIFKGAVTCRTCQHLKDVRSFVVVVTLRQRHKSSKIDKLTHLRAVDRQLDSLVLAWSSLKSFDEGGGQLRKPQLENGRKLGFPRGKSASAPADDQHQTGQICYRISYLTNKLTSQRMR